MPLARSCLYVPANREKFLEKAIALPADAFIFDLEDSVPAAEKADARAGVRAYAPRFPGNRVWVRVNGLDSGLAPDDLDAIIGVAGVVGIFLPKVETRDEVMRWVAMIGAVEHGRGMTPGAIKVVLSIESARGVLNAYDMAIAAERVVSLTFGGAQDGDLNTDLGCAWSIDGSEMLHARSHTLLAARAARFDTPLDGGYGRKTAGTINPGVAYVFDKYQLSIEAIVPVNRAGGTGLGVRAGVILFIDDLIPSLFGKPVFH